MGKGRIDRNQVNGPGIAAKHLSIVLEDPKLEDSNISPEDLIQKNPGIVMEKQVLKDLSITSEDPVVIADRKDMGGLGTILEDREVEDPAAENQVTEDQVAAEDLSIVLEDPIIEILDIEQENLALKVPGIAPEDQAIGINRKETDELGKAPENLAAKNPAAEDLTAVENPDIGNDS